MDAVVINGQLCMAQGKPVGWDAEELRLSGLSQAKSITSNSEIVRLHGPSRLYRS